MATPRKFLLCGLYPVIQNCLKLMQVRFQLCSFASRYLVSQYHFFSLFFCLFFVCLFVFPFLATLWHIKCSEIDLSCTCSLHHSWSDAVPASQCSRVAVNPLPISPLRNGGNSTAPFLIKIILSSSFSLGNCLSLNFPYIPRILSEFSDLSHWLMYMCLRWYYIIFFCVCVFLWLHL